MYYDSVSKSWEVIKEATHKMLKKLVLKIKKALNKRNEKGQSLVEYGLILALVSVVAISILTALGGQINSTVNTINNVLNNVNTSITTTGTGT